MYVVGREFLVSSDVEFNVVQGLLLCSLPCIQTLCLGGLRTPLPKVEYKLPYPRRLALGTESRPPGLCVHLFAFHHQEENECHRLRLALS
jgi:hypothetical protein